MQFHLNAAQKTAVEHKTGPLLIIAGAGTGKTAVLTQRIVHIVDKGWAKPEEILALTFTEKAAAEMQERVDVAMDYGYAEMWISTFHSFADRILKAEAHHIGLNPDFTLLTQASEYALMKRHLYELPFSRLRPPGNPSKNISQILSFFSRLQDENVRPKQFAKFVAKHARELKKGKQTSIAHGGEASSETLQEELAEYQELSKIYTAFTELKKRESAMSFGDLLINALDLFEQRPDILEMYMKKFKYVLVDEYQDTNVAQNILVNMLVLGRNYSKASKAKRKQANITVVGDDDQSIYKFRGAAIANIMEFSALYPDLTRVVLTENYRSAQKILDLGYELLQHNNPDRLEVTEKIDKKLVSRVVRDDKYPTDNVEMHFVDKEPAENEYIAMKILQLTGHRQNLATDNKVVSQMYDSSGQGMFVDLGGDDDAREYTFSDIAILVRANQHGEAIIPDLRYYGIPYKFSGKRSLYSREEIMFLLSYMRVLADPSDDKHMFNLLVNDLWGLEKNEIISIMQTARAKKIPVLQLLQKLMTGEENDAILPGVFEKVSPLLELIDQGFDMVIRKRPLTAIIHDFLKQSGYLKQLTTGDDEKNIYRVRNISKYFDVLRQFEKDLSKPTIYEYIDYLDYSINAGDTPRLDENAMDDLDAVSIMTVHASKGLEFPVVFLPSLVQQRFPARSKRDPYTVPAELISESVINTDPRRAHIAEERRLFYVAMTRAKEKLIMTAANCYDECKSKRKPSQFLSEAYGQDVSGEFKAINKDTDVSVIFRQDSAEDENEYSFIDDAYLHNTFSYSQLNRYKQCPMQYLYAEIYKIPMPPSPALSFGSSVHNALARFYVDHKEWKDNMFTDSQDAPGLEKLLGYYKQAWISQGYDNEKTEAARKREGKKVLEKYYAKFHDEELYPLAIEKPFTLQIDDIYIRGVIDRIDLLGKDEKTGKTTVRIIDYKTGRAKQKSEVKDDLQLPIYAMAAAEVFGWEVKELVYIFVEHAKTLTLTPEDIDFDAAKAEIKDIVQHIRNKDFKPKPTFFAKQYCPYKDICPYAG